MTAKKKAQVKKEKAQVAIKDCTFYGVKWDAKALATVEVIADSLEANAIALGENAKAISKMIDIFRSQNINIECLIKCG